MNISTEHEGREKNRVQASMTVETAFVLPIFLFILLNLLSLLEILSVYSKMEAALHRVGSEMSAYAYVYENGKEEFTALSQYAIQNEEGVLCIEDNDNAEVESIEEENTASENTVDLWEKTESLFWGQGYAREQVIAYYGRRQLDNSIVLGGTKGVFLWRSQVMEEDDCIDLVVTYRVEPWFNIYDIGSMQLINRCRIRAWTGYVKTEEESERQDTLVYITENATVYHTNRNCTHLLLSISQIPIEDVIYARNENGEKYTVCELCGDNLEVSAENVFISLQGNRYHSAISCSGLKRTILEVNRNDVGGLPMCSRCGSVFSK